MANGQDEHVLKQHGYTHKRGGIDPIEIVSKHSELTGLGANDHPQYVLKAGGTMTGLLTLSGEPTADAHAATKKYVDDRVGEVGWEIIVP